MKLKRYTEDGVGDDDVDNEDERKLEDAWNKRVKI